MGWASFKNGSLIQVAEEAGFTVMLTADKNLSYQQSLAGRRISIIIFGSIFTDFSGIRSLAPQVLRVLDDLPQGSFIVVKPD